MNTLAENRKSQLMNLGFIVLLMGITLYFLLKDHDLYSLFNMIGTVNLYFIGIGLFIMVLFFCFEAGCLHVLLGSLNHSTPFRHCFRYSLIDFYFSSITPGCCGGQPSQIYYMKRDGIPIGTSSLVLLLFNLAYHAAVLLIAFGSMLLAGKGLFAQMGGIQYLLFFGIFAQTFLIVAFVITIFSKKLMPAFVLKMTCLLAKTPIIKDENLAFQKVQDQIGEYQRGAAFIKQNPNILIQILFLAIFHIIALYSTSFWVYKAFGLSGANIITLIAVQAALTLAVESLPIPGGMGITESSFLLLYGGIFGSTMVIPALLLCRMINYYAFLIIGGIASAIPTKKREKPVYSAAVLMAAKSPASTAILRN